ncbi:hypothetical protein BGW80DRAFT_1458348 [Lactifluus volemus]|nr:hypothetical protein BGW80DRAFT_1458348 [Lactifluus volemus]
MPAICNDVIGVFPTRTFELRHPVFFISSRKMMDSDPPIDTSNPEVRDYLSLIRLQVLTPLSLLINIGTILVCALILHPSLGDITRSHPASISPSVPVIAAYIFALYLCQFQGSILPSLTWVDATEYHSQGRGPSPCIRKLVMAGWAIAWVFEAFLTSTILLGILTLLLIYSNLVLFVYHVPTWHRPLDLAFIHAPVRLFLILPLSLLFPYSLFVTLGHAWNPSHPDQYDRKQWEGFTYLLIVNIVGLLIVVLRRDWVWCLGATWVCISIWLKEPKPIAIYVVTIVFTVIHPLSLIAAVLTRHFTRTRQEGRIRLPPDEESDHQRSVLGGREIQADWS